MTLKERIDKDYIEAFKNRDIIKKTLLSVIKGEIQTIEKNTMVDNLSDDEVIKILNKSVKSLNEMIKTKNDEQSIVELEIIQSYLPKQMDDIEILVKISELVDDGVSNLGELMKAFSNLPADKKLVREIWNEFDVKL